MKELKHGKEKTPVPWNNIPVILPNWNIFKLEKNPPLSYDLHVEISIA